ncbi:acyltransferase [Flectobacillus sp. BAB-3569]|nr:acyltransferase [Flectobacillus sp. BAB-3569]
MNLSDYIMKRNGVPIGQPNSLRNNLQKSIGAKNFHTFWNYWNPIFSYYLGTKIFRPLKRVFPLLLSLILTFVFCGFIHDLVTTLLRGKLSLFFTVWFLLMSVFVVISKQLNYNLSDKKWLFRAFINLLIIGFCFCITKYLNTILNFY